VLLDLERSDRRQVTSSLVRSTFHVINTAPTPPAHESPGLTAVYVLAVIEGGKTQVVRLTFSRLDLQKSGSFVPTASPPILVYRRCHGKVTFIRVSVAVSPPSLASAMLDTGSRSPETPWR
jgi:hypothetical protein